MNNHIKQLLIKSEVLNKDGTIFKDITNYELNKFANLILKECCNIVHDKTHESIKVVFAIEQHFEID